jgi:hypothetical protein
MKELFHHVTAGLQRQFGTFFITLVEGERKDLWIIAAKLFCSGRDIFDFCIRFQHVNG